MSISTADLCDDHDVQVLEPMLRPFGGRASMAGPIRTVACFEDNSLVRKTLATPGDGAVLVVDGRGSRRCALLGDRLATLAVDNGWAGVVIHGCLRDSAEVDTMPVGVWALATHPRKSVKRGEGQLDVPVGFGGVRFVPGMWLYADADGILVADGPLG